MSREAEGALDFYCGSLGSGKTSAAADDAIDHLCLGGTVVGNIEWHKEVVAKYMRDVHGLVFDEKRLVRIDDGKDIWKFAIRGSKALETMLIIDEAHVEHNARSWDKTTSEEVMFNTMVRKLRIRLLYITQDINNTDKQFRRMAQRIVYCRNLKQYKILGVSPFPINMFFRVPYLCGPGVQPKMMPPEIVLRPKSWGMFNSHHLVGKALQTFGGLVESEQSPLLRCKRQIPYLELTAAVAGASAALLTVY